MQILRSVPDAASSPVALTIGNFDGVHLGHQAMLAKLRAAASVRGLPACVMTFEPHPREFFAPDQAPVRLTTLREKLQIAWCAATNSDVNSVSRRRTCR
jgi:riboflavin kinase/FMN adenylyltransferase